MNTDNQELEWGSPAYIEWYQQEYLKWEARLSDEKRDALVSGVDSNDR